MVSINLLTKFGHLILCHLIRFGRDTFQESMKIASRMNFDALDWTVFKYMVFDIPYHQGSYRERYSILERLASHTLLPSFFEVVPKTECKGRDHLEQLLQDIVDNGGEGIILRNPEATYEGGRSKGFLKHKVSHLPPPPQKTTTPRPHTCAL